MKKKYNIFYTNNHGNILTLACLRFVYSRDTPAILIIPDSFEYYESHLFKQYIKSEIFDIIISADLSISFFEIEEEIALNKLVDYYDQILKQHDLLYSDINDVYTIPDNLNPVGIWASYHDISLIIIEDGYHHFQWSWRYYELLKFGVANQLFCDLQKKYHVLLGENSRHAIVTHSNYESFSLDNINYSELYKLLSNKERLCLLNVYEIANSCNYYNNSYMLILNTHILLSDQINTVYQQTGEISIFQYNKVYLDLLNYFGDDNAHLVIKMHPQEKDYVDMSFYRNSSLCGNFPIELFNFIDNFHFSQVLSFGSTSLDKISNISLCSNDYGISMYAYAPIIHQFMTAITISSLYIGNNNICYNMINLESSQLYTIINKLCGNSNHISVNDMINDAPTTYIQSIHGKKNQIQIKGDDAVIYLDYFESDIKRYSDPSNIVLRIDLLLSKTEDGLINNPRYLKPIYIESKSDAIVKKIKNCNYSKKLFYTMEFLQAKVSQI